MTGTTPWWIRDTAKLDELTVALRDHAPWLRMHINDQELTARGPFVLAADGAAQDIYAIVMRYDPHNHQAEPKVWEIGGAIERLEDNHVNVVDGSCCLGVVDEWLAKTGDTSFAGFVTGPLWNFFLSQAIFRRTGRWIFEERPHGLPGMIEAYGELVGDSVPTLERLARTLSFLSLERIKGHWQCPCGGGRRVRNCCQKRLEKLDLGPQLSARLFNRLAAQAVANRRAPSHEALAYRKQ